MFSSAMIWLVPLVKCGDGVRGFSSIATTDGPLEIRELELNTIFFDSILYTGLKCYYYHLLSGHFIHLLRVWLNFVTPNSEPRIDQGKEEALRKRKTKTATTTTLKRKWSEKEKSRQKRKVIKKKEENISHRGRKIRPKENWWCWYVTQFVFGRSIYLNVILLFLRSFVRPFCSFPLIFFSLYFLCCCVRSLLKSMHTHKESAAIVLPFIEMGPMWFKTMKQTPFQDIMACGDKKKLVLKLKKKKIISKWGAFYVFGTFRRYCINFGHLPSYNTSVRFELENTGVTFSPKQTKNKLKERKWEKKEKKFFLQVQIFLLCFLTIFPRLISQFEPMYLTTHSPVCHSVWCRCINSLDW